MGLEGVLAAVELEVESNSSVLGELGSISLYMLAELCGDHFELEAYQLQDTSGSRLLIGMLDEVQKTLASDAGPGSSGVGNVGLLAAKVGAQAGSGNGGLVAEPEVLL